MSISHTRPEELAVRGRSEGLPNTAYAVLGLLSLGQELSGYDLWQWAQNLRFFYWSPAHSQIYAELRRLEERGLVTSRKVAQEHRPDKRLYRITDVGLAEARRWFDQAPVEPTVMKHSVALRLFFGHLARPERLPEILGEYAEALQKTLAELTAVHEGLRGSEQFRFPALVAEWGLAYYQGEISAARSASEQLLTSQRQVRSSRHGADPGDPDHEQGT
jgi:DNA-binding PadR family transcriptional regulator